MAVKKELFLLFLRVNSLLAIDYAHEKPVAALPWQGRCTLHKIALNDCNWCRCNSKQQYACEARVCTLVDKFGHFNDAIQDIDVGMEGKGSWRSKQLACEPGVQYRRAGLLCVCTDEGVWPNPLCRDIFRILYSVELTGDHEATGQSCTSTKLYLVGCNVCICPSSGRLDPELCTKKVCSAHDVVNSIEQEQSENQDVEIYAECNPDHKYKLGCKTCSCLRNNRLQCDNCTSSEKDTNIRQSFCSHFKPGQPFSRDCNLCYCDEKKFVYCSAKKCLPDQQKIVSKSPSTDVIESSDTFDEENCVPGHSYKVGCNTCVCESKDGRKYFACTTKACSRRNERAEEKIHIDCVAGTVYELNCLICQCDEVYGVKTQLCWVNPKCTGKDAVRETRSSDLDSLHGYCEPLHMYKLGCNTCHCLANGKTVRCTSYVCERTAQPITIDIVPVAQSGKCPRGLSYNIDCNYCFCLANGNALCTTIDCKKKDGSSYQLANKYLGQ